MSRHDIAFPALANHHPRKSRSAVNCLGVLHIMIPSAHRAMPSLKQHV